jgi:hypothetical protein
MKIHSPIPRDNFAMRIQPPKTRKKTFTREEFKSYFLKHTLNFSDGMSVGLQAFFPDDRGFIAVTWKEFPLINLIQMFPFEHQWIVKEILEEFEKK